MLILILFFFLSRLDYRSQVFFIPAIIWTFCVVVLAAHIWLIIRRIKEKRTQNKVRFRDSSLINFIVPLIVLDVQVIGFLTILLCSFVPQWYVQLCIVLLALLILGLLIGLLTQWLNWKRFLIWCGCLALTIGGLYGSHLYVRHIEDITLPESFDYKTYMPFTAGSLVKSLDEPATLHFEDFDTVPHMDGATALYPVYAAFAQATYPDSMNEMTSGSILAKVTCSTTSSAYVYIVNGACDIIFVGGPSEEQEKYAAERGVELVYTPIGKEAFVFFVNPDNPIEELTLQEIRAIYSGETTRWDQLGVSGLGSILAFQREKGSGSQTALERFVMKDTPLAPAVKENVIGGMGGIVEKVSSYKNHKNAIGYSFRFYCTALMKNFDVKLLSVNGITPTTENIENGTYPLASCFYAVTRSDADENTLALVEWICGPQGQALVEKCGYTPVGAGE